MESGLVVYAGGIRRLLARFSDCNKRCVQESRAALGSRFYFVNVNRLGTMVERSLNLHLLACQIFGFVLVIEFVGVFAVSS
jgi:hypothetical protein